LSEIPYVNNPALATAASTAFRTAPEELYRNAMAKKTDEVAASIAWATLPNDRLASAWGEKQKEYSMPEGSPISCQSFSIGEPRNFLAFVQ
jgi:hypothetical protein